MWTFRVALTGDFLNEAGQPAYTDSGLHRLASRPYVRYRFLTRQAPRRGDRDYWRRFYSLVVTPKQIEGIDGLVVLRPWVKRSTFVAPAGSNTAVTRSPMRTASGLAPTRFVSTLGPSSSST